MSRRIAAGLTLAALALVGVVGAASATSQPSTAQASVTWDGMRH